MNRLLAIVILLLGAIGIYGGWQWYAASRANERGGAGRSNEHDALRREVIVEWPEQLRHKVKRPGQSLANAEELEAIEEMPTPAPRRRVLPSGTTVKTCYRQLVDLRREHFLDEADPIPRQRLVDGLIQCGWLALRRGEPNVAEDWFREALEVDSQTLEAWRGLGYTFHQQRSYRAAIDALRRFLAENERDAETLRFLGKVYYQSGDLAMAEYYLEQGEALDGRTGKLLEVTRRRQAVESEFWVSESRHFRVKFDARQYREMASWVMNTLEEAYEGIGASLRFFPEQPIVAVLYTGQEFRDITRSPKWTGALFDGEIRLPVKGLDADPNLLQRLRPVLFHEYAHAAIYRVGHGRCPTWINEGLAQYFEYGAQRPSGGLPDRATLLGLDELNRSFMGMSTPQAKVAYRQSLIMVEYLLRRAGMANLVDYLHRVAYESPLTAFEQVYGVSMKDFYEHWIAGYPP